MAVSLNSQVLTDAARNFVIRLTGLGDGTGIQLTNVKVVDVEAMTPPAGPSLKVTRYDSRIFGGIVTLSWEAPLPVVFAELQLSDHVDWRYFGGQSTLNVPDATGSILLSTRDFTVGSSFDLTLSCVKGVGSPKG